MSKALDRLKNLKTAKQGSAKSDITPLLALMALPHIDDSGKLDHPASNDNEHLKSEKHAVTKVPKVTQPPSGTYGTALTEHFQGLSRLIVRMAEFYRYTAGELKHALDGAAQDPEAWGEIVRISRKRWQWTLEGNETHPWLGLGNETDEAMPDSYEPTSCIDAPDGWQLSEGMGERVILINQGRLIDSAVFRTEAGARAFLTLLDTYPPPQAFRAACAIEDGQRDPVTLDELIHDAKAGKA